ncbi:MAG: hypothetical protein H7268_14145 [Sandarakinorhabdus sp.]|nr:hypothetical protein [Sandarakinorhabdus sp.]
MSEGTLIDLDSPTREKEITNVVLGAQWRVGSRHRISGLYFTSRKICALSFNQSVIVGDETLVPPTTLDSKTKNHFIFATYESLFVKNDIVEITGLLGAYADKFSAELQGNATAKNINGTTTISKAVDYTPSVTVPMPLIGASINWFATRKLSVGAQLSGLKAKIGDVDRSVFVAGATVEYIFTRNIGGGLAYMHTSANVGVTKTSFAGHVDWKNDNFLLYALFKF